MSDFWKGYRDGIFLFFQGLDQAFLGQDLLIMKKYCGLDFEKCLKLVKNPVLSRYFKKTNSDCEK